MASRIQKLPGTTFAFNRRGINIDDPAADDFFKTHITVKKMAVRGIGENELVCVLKSEYDALTETERQHFRNI